MCAEKQSDDIPEGDNIKYLVLNTTAVTRTFWQFNLRLASDSEGPSRPNQISSVCSSKSIGR